MASNRHEPLYGILTKRQLLSELEPLSVLNQCILGFLQQRAGFDDARHRFPPTGNDPVAVGLPVATYDLTTNRLAIGQRNGGAGGLASLPPLPALVTLSL